MLPPADAVNRRPLALINELDKESGGVTSGEAEASNAGKSPIPAENHPLSLVMMLVTLTWSTATENASQAQSLPFVQGTRAERIRQKSSIE